MPLIYCAPAGQEFQQRLIAALGLISGQGEIHDDLLALHPILEAVKEIWDVYDQLRMLENRQYVSAQIDFKLIRSTRRRNAEEHLQFKNGRSMDPENIRTGIGQLAVNV
jgi:hypothetical protein